MANLTATRSETEYEIVQGLNWVQPKKAKVSSNATLQNVKPTRMNFETALRIVAQKREQQQRQAYNQIDQVVNDWDGENVRECEACGETEEHDADDTICQVCRMIYQQSENEERAEQEAFLKEHAKANAPSLSALNRAESSEM